MKKFSVLLFCITILGFSFYDLSTSSFYVQLLMNNSLPFIYARIALATALIMYAFVPSLRLYTTKTLFSAVGILMLLLGLISVGSPSLLGNINTYILLGDSLTLIEGGILAIVLSAELSAQRSRFVMHNLDYMRSLLSTSPRGVAFTQPTNGADQDTSLAQHLENANAVVHASTHLVKRATVPSNVRP